MEYVTLNNGVQMPLVGFGTFMLSGETCTNAVASSFSPFHDYSLLAYFF